MTGRGEVFASRLREADSFAIISGVIVPVDWHMTEDVVTDALACRHPDPERVGDDSRFATTTYRAALDCGIEHVAFN